MSGTGRKPEGMGVQNLEAKESERSALEGLKGFWAGWNMSQRGKLPGPGPLPAKSLPLGR